MLLQLLLRKLENNKLWHLQQLRLPVLQVNNEHHRYQRLPHHRQKLNLQLTLPLFLQVPWLHILKTIRRLLQVSF